MLFSVESFFEAPTLSSLTALKRSDLLARANHYKLETTSEMRKDEMQTVLIEYLINKEILTEDEMVIVETTSAVELKNRGLRKGERARRPVMPQGTRI